MDSGTDLYYARVGWWLDGTVMAQVQNRAQTCLKLLRIDPRTGDCVVLLTEESPCWINLHDMLRCIPLDWSPPSSSTSPGGDFYFLWASERSGYMSLYLHKFDSHTGTTEVVSEPVGRGGGNTVIGSVDEGRGDGDNRDDCDCDNWVVDSLEDVVITSGSGSGSGITVYYCASAGRATEKQLFRSPVVLLPAAAAATSSSGVAGDADIVFVSGSSSSNSFSRRVQLTASSHWHTCAVSGKLGVFVDISSSLISAPVTSVCFLDTLRRFEIYDNSSNEFSMAEALRFCVHPPTGHCIPPPPTDSGASTSARRVHSLAACVYRPDPARFGEGPHPAIVAVYGGPHVQR